MSLTDHIALVSLTRDISTRTLLLAAAAIQKQLTRDFLPIWGQPATVDAFEDLTSVPSDYYHVVIFGDGEELADQLTFAIGAEQAARLVEEFSQERLAGIHLNAFTRQPFALVSASDSWTVTASHEVLELVADPFGNRLRASMHPFLPEQRVRYLLEVCDPCQSVWYSVNGVPVADFYTPWYLEPVRVTGTRYSFTGSLTRPLELLPGGYLTWLDPADSGLYQLHEGEREPILVADVLQLRRTSTPLRAIVDADPRTPRVSWDMLGPASTAPSTSKANAAMREASQGAAQRTAQAVLSIATEPD